MELIGVVGYSSTGKSTSLMNMPHEETCILSPYKEDLPIGGFNSKYKLLNSKDHTGNFVVVDDMVQLPNIIEYISENRPDIKYIIQEDFTHHFNQQTQSAKFRKRSTGNDAWARWGDLGANVYNALFKKGNFRKDLWTITFYHPEEYISPYGVEGKKLRIKTPGQLLDREIDIPSYYNYLLFSKVLPYDPKLKAEDRYKFVTNDDGFHSAKTPLGCFSEIEIPNDLYAVIKRIKEFKNIK